MLDGVWTQFCWIFTPRNLTTAFSGLAVHRNTSVTLDSTIICLCLCLQALARALSEHGTFVVVDEEGRRLGTAPIVHPASGRGGIDDREYGAVLAKAGRMSRAWLELQAWTKVCPSAREPHMLHSWACGLEYVDKLRCFETRFVYFGMLH
jgi:hypothetical protein